MDLFLILRLYDSFHTQKWNIFFQIHKWARYARAFREKVIPCHQKLREMPRYDDFLVYLQDIQLAIAVTIISPAVVHTMHNNRNNIPIIYLLLKNLRQEVSSNSSVD